LKTLVCEIYRLQILYLAETYTGAVPLTVWCDSFGQSKTSRTKHFPWCECCSICCCFFVIM